MIAMTTSNSISVKPRRPNDSRRIDERCIDVSVMDEREPQHIPRFTRTDYSTELARFELQLERGRFAMSGRSPLR
jgi:hypothetical protein